MLPPLTTTLVALLVSALLPVSEPADQHPPPSAETSAVTSDLCLVDWPQTAEDTTRCWIEAVFEPGDWATALEVARWESAHRFDPGINNFEGSDASGLFQHRARYWESRETKARNWLADQHQIVFDQPLEIYNGWHSTIVTAWLVYDTPGGWSHFHSCQSGQRAFNRWAEAQNTDRWDRWLEQNRHSGGWVDC